MSKFLGETRLRRGIQRATEWLVVAFASLMALLSTLRLLGIVT